MILGDIGRYLAQDVHFTSHLKSHIYMFISVKNVVAIKGFAPT